MWRNARGATGWRWRGRTRRRPERELRYSRTGEVQWTRTAEDEVGDTEAFAVTVDTAGAIVVVGCAAYPRRYWDVWLRKLDAAGETIWTQRYDGEAGKVDVLRAVSTNSENVIAVGGRSGQLDGSTDIWLRAYAP